MEWKKAKVDRLIELYEQESVLWDVRSASHKNANTRNDALQRISEVLECPITEVERKLHNLRSQFLREKTKIEKSKKSAAGAVDVYVSKWQYFQTLSFLRKSTERVPHTSSLSLDCLDLPQANQDPKDPDDSTLEENIDNGQSESAYSAPEPEPPRVEPTSDQHSPKTNEPARGKIKRAKNAFSRNQNRCWKKSLIMHMRFLHQLCKNRKTKMYVLENMWVSL